MKNPFLEAMQGPMSLAPATKFMQMLQEQHSDTLETSMKAVACREPMALVSLQQDYLKRMVERWTKMASAVAPTAKAARKAAPKPAPAPAPKAPAPAPVVAVKAQPAPKPTPVKVWDDLTVIKGIGPKFAKTLNEHGITSYRQLAELSAADVATLEAKLGFSGRFEREGWIEQARALAH